MKRVILIVILFSTIFSGTPNAYAGTDVDHQYLVFVANQSWFSRIYLMEMNGSVVTYHEYEYYIFSDVTVVNNELYVADWVAPALYCLDPFTGALDIVVSDLWLNSMYDVAWDGEFFYIDEWDLNRYDINGVRTAQRISVMLCGDPRLMRRITGRSWIPGRLNAGIFLAGR